MARIVLLDESVDNLKRLQEALAGHQVFSVMTAELALQLVRDLGIDLVLVAVHLEQSDVFQFLRRVVEIGKQSDREARVVLVSCRAGDTARYATDIVRAAATSLGAYRYILDNAVITGRFKAEVEACLPPPRSFWQRGASRV